MNDNYEMLKYGGDGLSIMVVIGTLSQFLPSVAALLTIAWTAVRLYETKTVQGWLGRKPKTDAGSATAGDGE